MGVKGVVREGKFEFVCEDCNRVVMSDIIVSDNGQPFLHVSCRLCKESADLELDSDAWPHLASRIKK